MSLREDLRRWIWPRASAEVSLASWRSSLTAYTLRVLIVGAVMTLALVVASYWPPPLPTAVWIVVASYPLTLVLLATVGRTPRARAAIVLSTFLFISPLLFSTFGPSLPGFMCLLMACVLASVLIGPRAAGTFMAGSLLLVVLGAQAHRRGWGMEDRTRPWPCCGNARSGTGSR